MTDRPLNQVAVLSANLFDRRGGGIRSRGVLPRYFILVRAMSEVAILSGNAAIITRVYDDLVWWHLQ